jgi:hypothetical protein
VERVRVTFESIEDIDVMDIGQLGEGDFAAGYLMSVVGLNGDKNLLSG